MSAADPLDIRAVDTVDERMIDALAELWNGALPADLAITGAFVRYNVQPSAGVARRLFVAEVDGALAGAALATVLHGEPSVNSHGEGWIDLMAVAPAHRRRGLGRALLAAAEAWLAGQGCAQASIGAGPRPFTPGLPDPTDAAPFFAACRYESGGTAWDMASNLAGYTPPDVVREIAGVVRPATPRHADDLLAFLRREFPGRWRYEAEAFLADGGRLSDYMLLWTERGVDGCCLLTFPDSMRPMERYYPYRLPKPWGQLGSIGVSADRRGQGYGAALLDAGLRRLHDNGINGCVIDWTGLVDFYARFGFERYRSYTMLARSLQ
ncbi:MAG: GNAT family N-acetyltransferase [Caldilineaceae bacterium]|nr:GNAT family N-acetyltransferase [Caldilineaceae bacterium]